MGVLFLWGKATRFAQTSFPRQKSTPTPPRNSPQHEGYKATTEIKEP